MKFHSLERSSQEIQAVFSCGICVWLSLTFSVMHMRTLKREKRPYGLIWMKIDKAFVLQITLVCICP